jgi:hypothetical protein
VRRAVRCATSACGALGTSAGYLGRTSISANARRACRTSIDDEVAADVDVPVVQKNDRLQGMELSPLA